MATCEVDQFTTQASLDAFDNRYKDVAQSIIALGLHEHDPSVEPAIVIGGAALTLQQVDAYIPYGRPFDVDVIVPVETFLQLHRQARFSGGAEKFSSGAQGFVLPNESIPLKVDVLTSEDPTDFEIFMSDVPLDVATYSFGNFNVLKGELIALQKSLVPVSRVKDLAGLVKGHVVATHIGNPLVGEESWQVAMGLVIERLIKKDVYGVPFWRKIMKKGPEYPSWLWQLIDRDFDHPAFTNIQRAEEE